MSLPWLADVLRLSGHPVDEDPGWQTRRRAGSFAPVGVLIHHTGSLASDTRAFPTRTTLLGGRPDLPGPLCQVSPDYAGVLHVLAGGRSNHGGTARASGPVPAGDANALYVGFELDYSGTQPPSGAQYAAAVAGAGEVVRRLGVTADHVRGHRETSVTGKWDPGLIDMDEFRADVRNYLTNSTQEDVMNERQEKKFDEKLDQVLTAIGSMARNVDDIEGGVAGLPALIRAVPSQRVDVDELADVLVDKLDRADVTALADRLTIVVKDA